MSNNDEICAPLQWRVLAVGREWLMKPGDILTFGRGSDRDIRFGHSPEDDYVSNEAGRLVAEEDVVLVQNDSRTQGIVLEPFPGAEQNIAPGAVLGLRRKYLNVIVPGGYDVTYTIRLARQGPPEPPGPLVLLRTASADRKPTRSGPSSLTPRERKLLAALCEPLLIFAGSAAVPATYEMIARRTGGKRDAVRNTLDNLRARLSMEGIPGLRHVDDDEVPRADYRAALARWALDSGTITVADLKLLAPPS